MFYTWKIHLFSKKNNFCTFSEVLLFQSLSTGNLQHSAYLNTINFSNEEPFSVSKKTHFLKFLRSVTISVAFYGKFAKPSEYKIVENFFQKNHFIFSKTQKFERFAKCHWIVCFSDYFFLTKSNIESFGNFTNSVAFHDKFATFTDI